MFRRPSVERRQCLADIESDEFALPAGPQLVHPLRVRQQRPSDRDDVELVIGELTQHRLDRCRFDIAHLRRFELRLQPDRANGDGRQAGESFGPARQAQLSVGARQLLVETSGPKDEVVKLLPALTTTDEQLDIGIATLREAITESAQ